MEAYDIQRNTFLLCRSHPCLAEAQNIVKEMKCIIIQKNTLCRELPSRVSGQGMCSLVSSADSDFGSARGPSSKNVSMLRKQKFQEQ